MSPVAGKKLPITWTVTIILALLFGAYFLRSYIPVIMVAAIAAFIFNPVYQFLLKHYKRRGTAASATFVISLLVIIIPLSLIVIACYFQIKHLVTELAANPHADLGDLSTSALKAINNFLAHLPGSPQISTTDLNNAINKFISNLANALLGFVSSSASSISRIMTSFIIYIYLFVNILMHQEELLKMLRKLNPLGADMSDKYQNRAGKMTKAVIIGQFVIAILQGNESAIVLYLVGFHSLALFFAILLSFMSLIPLGAGIVTIPIGIGLILTGNIWQGALVIANHLLIVTNIDNVMRPILIPKSVRLNSALTLLSVFAGLSMFGFLGIVVGPVIMILIVTTIESYVELRDSTKPVLKQNKAG